jgi:hypothetical protein
VNVVMNFGFHKMQGISQLANDLLASQEGLCSMELVSYPPLCCDFVLHSGDKRPIISTLRFSCIYFYTNLMVLLYFCF